jgi:hypothetical protein
LKVSPAKCRDEFIYNVFPLFWAGGGISKAALITL